MSSIETVVPRVTDSGDGSPRRRVEVTVRAGPERYDLYFASDDPVLAASPESLITMTLLPAMARGAAISLESEVSAQFLASVATAQDIYALWGEPWRVPLRRVEIRDAAPSARPARRTGRVATFFSGGVDSFYTLLKHEAEITDLIFVHGFDIRLDDTPLREATSRMIREIGAALGKTVIEVETNFRELSDRTMRWGYAHGTGLATIAHVLSHRFDRVYVPSSSAYHDLFPWGSHPLLDRNWGTEGLEYVHDGCEARRIEKVARVARSDVALRTLRVCYKNPGSAYNCGHCEKCVRTMISLRIAGALNRCATFPMPLEMQYVRKIRGNDHTIRPFVVENLAALRAAGIDPELQAALQELLRPKPRPPRPPRPWRALAREALAAYPRVTRAMGVVRRARRLFSRRGESGRRSPGTAPRPAAS